MRFSVSVRSSDPNTLISSSKFLLYRSRTYCSLCFKYTCLDFYLSSGNILLMSSKEVSSFCPLALSLIFILCTSYSFSSLSFSFISLSNSFWSRLFRPSAIFCRSLFFYFMSLRSFSSLVTSYCSSMTSSSEASSSTILYDFGYCTTTG
jgi:hypothetical protein